mgnify:CR=1 FL=1
MAGGGKIENIVSDDKYIIIYDWIHQYLKLNGNEAEAFALIYSFYQKEGFFGGSAGYISKRLYIPFRTGQRILEKLEKYKYITKEKGDYKTCNKYFINLDYISSLVPYLNIRQNVISADLEHTTKCRKGIRQNVVRDTTKCRTSIKYSNKDSNNIYAHSENEQVYNHEDDKQKEDDNHSSNIIKQDTKNKAIKKQNKELNELQEKQFDKFWQAYPKKVSKKQAQKSWKKINPSLELFEKILKALEMVKQTEQWKKDNGKYVPYPATWLNQERWTDEINMMQDTIKKEPKKKIIYKPAGRIDLLKNNF